MKHNPNASTLTQVDINEYTQFVEAMLAQAKQQGASAAEVGASLETGFSVQVRMGEVETVEFNRDKGVGLTVYFGQRKGSASTSDTSPQAIKETVAAACHIARYTSEDDCAGLADKDLLAFSYPELDLYHPWAIDTDQAIEMAKECETAGRNFDKRISNSEGANVATYQSLTAYGNSDGFIGTFLSSRHSLQCSLLAQNERGMQRDYEYSVAREAGLLLPPSEIGRKAAQKTVARLGARRLKTQKVPVIFSNEMATGLISRFLTAIRGSSQYRKSSFLLDHLNKPVFAPHINIYERPHLPRALGSAPFDNEGVMAHDRSLIEHGILKEYILSTYSARKLGLRSTGNAGGIYNIILDTSDKDLAALIKTMGRGLLVTEVMGQGVNMVTGDYSRGATGFWIENGAIQYPVEEITIAGNLKDMLRQIVYIGNDINRNSTIATGSILLEEMMVAGE